MWADDGKTCGGSGAQMHTGRADPERKQKGVVETMKGPNIKVEITDGLSEEELRQRGLIA